MFRIPNSVVVVTGDLNSFKFDVLNYDCSLSLINYPEAFIRGNRFLDKRLVSQPDVNLCRAVRSSIKTKREALHTSDINIALRSREPQRNVHCLCYDIRMPH
jgi:hypothetical protein